MENKYENKNGTFCYAPAELYWTVVWDAHKKANELILNWIIKNKIIIRGSLRNIAKKFLKNTPEVKNFEFITSNYVTNYIVYLIKTEEVKVVGKYTIFFSKKDYFDFESLDNLKHDINDFKF